jgi:hypothetical protein
MDAAPVGVIAAWAGGIATPVGIRPPRAGLASAGAGDAKAGGCDTNVYGPATVDVTVKQNDPIWTKDITVTCASTPR